MTTLRTGGGAAVGRVMGMVPATARRPGPRAPAPTMYHRSGLASPPAALFRSTFRDRPPGVRCRDERTHSTPPPPPACRHGRRGHDLRGHLLAAVPTGPRRGPVPPRLRA